MKKLFILALLVPLCGCASNPAATPAMIRAASAILVITNPEICDEVPFTDIQSALDEAQAIKNEAAVLCGATD